MLNNSKISNSDFLNSNFELVELIDVQINNSKFDRATFKLSNLTRAKFIECNLTGANFNNTNLKNSTFERCDLKNVEDWHKSSELASCNYSTSVNIPNIN
ncbi:pentapeptide repeat-containing protein [Flavobacterium piscisymbiosum]|uniref:pentapeptide repeat-containing protein n=1 Tax=Flavobacterium piscisymbiosum TaxID=2893753 RepID=UPI003D179E61